METLKYHLQKYIDILDDYICQKIINLLDKEGELSQREIMIKLRLDPSERRNMYRYVAQLIDVCAIREVISDNYDGRYKMLELVPGWHNHLQSLHLLITNYEGHSGQDETD